MISSQSPSQRFLHAITWGEDTSVKELSIRSRLNLDQTLQQLVHYFGEHMLRVSSSESAQVLDPITLIGHSRDKIFLQKSKKLATLLASTK